MDLPLDFLAWTFDTYHLILDYLCTLVGYFHLGTFVLISHVDLFLLVMYVRLPLLWLLNVSDMTPFIVILLPLSGWGVTIYGIRDRFRNP